MPRSTRVETPHFRLYARSSDDATARLSALGERAEEALRHNISVLDEREYPRVIDLVLLDSPKRVTYADPIEEVVFLHVTRSGMRTIRHEVMHVVTFWLWGEPVPAQQWLIEGIPGLAAEGCHGYTFHQLVATIVNEGRWVDLSTLFSQRQTGEGDLRFYFESASFLQFIRDTYGVGALRRLWTVGPTATAQERGIRLTELQSAWLRSLGRVPIAGHEIDWSVLETDGCDDPLE